jgi:hypothetical protein
MKKYTYLLILLYNHAKIAPAIPQSTKPHTAPTTLPVGVKLYPIYIL